MKTGRGALAARSGLALLALAALPFLKPLEDAYLLPELAVLAAAALALLAGLGAVAAPATPVFWLGLGLHVWRLACHFASPDRPPHGPFLCAEIPELALFVALACALRVPAHRRRLAGALLAAGALGAAYSLLAPLGLDPFSAGAEDLGFGRRAFGALGNPDFLGGWLAMLLPLVPACLVGAGRRARPWIAASALIMVPALALTLARGSWAAAAVGGAVAVGVSGWRPSRWFPAWAAAAGLGTVALLALGPGWGAVSGRMDEAAARSSDAWASRALMSGVALDMARERPILGVGGGAFEMEYLRLQAPRLWKDRGQPFRRTADAHDDWLQAAAETGWPGLLLLAALFVVALRACLAEGGPAAGAAAGALAAFAVQGCFHFPGDIPPTAALAQAALALAAGFQAAPGGPALPRILRVGALAGLAACLLLDLRRAASSGMLNAGTALERNAATAEGPLAVPLLEEAARLEPGDGRAWSRLGGADLGRGDPEAAADDFRQALRVLPSDPDAWTNLGLSLGSAGDPRRAVACLREAVELDPRSNVAWSDLAKAEDLLGDRDGALADARRGIAEAGGSPQAWFNLGALLYNAGRRREAAPDFAEALRMDPRTPQARRLLDECLRAP